MTLSDAMAAARVGRREEARALLMRVLETDERNVQAWLWLSGVVDDPEEMRICLSNVLHLEPNNAHALKGMAIIEQRYGTPQVREVGQPIAAREVGQPVAAPVQPAKPVDPVMDILSRSGPSPVFAPAAPAQPAAPTPSAPAPAPAAPAKPIDPVMDILARSGPSPVFVPASGAVPATVQNEPSGQPSTGSTISLPPSPDLAIPISSASDPTIGLGPAPCPCCGYNAPLSKTRCPQCHKSMLLFTLPDHLKGSRALTILVFLWALPTILAYASNIVLSIGVLITGTSEGAPVAAGAIVGSLFFNMVVRGIFLMPVFFFWRAVYQKRKWAYVVACVWQGFATLLYLTIMILLLMATRGAFGDELQQILTASRLSQGFVWGITIFALLWTVLEDVLVIMGHADVYGGYQRVPYEVTKADSGTHYNYGVELKNKGMWYAAMLEWEAAVYTSPKDTHYLHALALAQAQLKLRDKALATMRQALGLEPSNGTLQETFRLIQQGQI